MPDLTLLEKRFVERCESEFLAVDFVALYEAVDAHGAWRQSEICDYALKLVYIIVMRKRDKEIVAQLSSILEHLQDSDSAHTITKTKIMYIITVLSAQQHCLSVKDDDHFHNSIYI